MRLSELHENQVPEEDNSSDLAAISDSKNSHPNYQKNSDDPHWLLAQPGMAECARDAVIDLGFEPTYENMVKLLQDDLCNRI